MPIIDGTAGNDSLSGNNGVSDTINGLDGNDTLHGGSGNISDTLDGGTGVDSMNGGDGSDTYIVDNVGDICAEAFNDVIGGTADTVFASVSYTISGNGIENLTLTGGAATGTGNGNANIILGNGSNNTLSGLAGNDTLDGGFGFDTFDGGDGIDAVDYRFWNFGLTVNLATGVASFEGNVPTESLTNIENILAGAGNDSITGSTAANSLDGGVGNDTMDGGGGNDTLVGGAGNDLLIASAGVDNLSGGDGDDGFQLNGATNIAGWVVDGGAGADVVDLIEGTLQLGTSLPFLAVEQLDVWQTTFVGTAGGDSYDFRPFATIGFGVGQAVVLNAGDGDDVVYTSNSVVDGGGAHAVDGQNGNDTLTGGTARDSLSGGANDDVLFGGGGNDVLIGGDGNDALNGAGSSNDSLNGGNGNDTLSGGGGNDSSSGGEGDDFVYAVIGTDVADGGNGNDTLDTTAYAGDYVVNLSTGLTNFIGESYVAFENLVSGAGNDSLTGTAGVNRIVGGAGNDTIDGGTGADTMEGGAGSDTYVVDNASDVTTETSTLASERDTVLSSVTRSLGANLENLTLTGSAAINGNGNALANVLIGNDGVNTLVAGAGNDTLNGGLGADTMDGGDQNDLYVVDNAGDIAGEFFNDAGGGNDTVESSVSYAFDGLGSNQRGYGLENLVLTGTADIDGSGNGNANALTGNSGNNRLDGGSGSDTLSGGAGDDTLDGGTGPDTMDGGDGDDLYIVHDAGDLVEESTGGPGSGNDSVQSRATHVLGAGIENLLLTGTAAIDGTGNALDNSIVGNGAANALADGDGSDTLSGGGGNDTLTSGAGDDVLAGGADDDRLVSTAGSDVLVGGTGNDTYVVEDDADVLVEGVGGGIDTVQSGAAIRLAANVENAQLLGAAAVGVTGNALANDIVGNDGANRLDGSTGADTMEGGAGGDTYVVNEAGDTIEETSTDVAQIDGVVSSLTWTLGANLENLLLSGSAAIHGTGNALANAMTGNTGANILDGAAGHDSLVGGSGNDSLIGGTGNDTLDGGLGNDSMTGGTGNDTYTVNATGDRTVETGTSLTEIDLVRAGLSWTLAVNVEQLLLTGTTAMNGTGNASANRLTGNAGANTLSGLTGKDTLDGAGGNDILDGGIGNDSLIGGLGNDTFRFATTLSATTNVDVVSGFSHVDDRFLLEDAVFAGIGPVGALAAGAFRIGSGALDADDRIIYNKAQGKLYFDKDGFGGTGPVLFATVGVNADVRADDFFVS